MSSVTIKNVRKNYGNLEVVHGINLTIEDGSFVVLLGPSGCGKSTLLRLVAGLETPTAGEIQLDGTNIVGAGADRGVVFQDFAQLFPWRTALGNVAFGLEMKGIGKDERAARKHDWLAATILTLRDEIIDKWMASTRQAHAAGAKRVYYLSLEFLIGRLLRDALSNLGRNAEVGEALASLGVDRWRAPDAAARRTHLCHAVRLLAGFLRLRLDHVRFPDLPPAGRRERHYASAEAAARVVCPAARALFGVFFARL